MQDRQRLLGDLGLGGGGGDYGDVIPIVFKSAPAAAPLRGPLLPVGRRQGGSISARIASWQRTGAVAAASGQPRGRVAEKGA